MKSATLLVTTTYHNWRAHRTIRLGAGLAYYALFAFVPMLAIATAVAGLVLSDEKVQSYLDGRIQELIGPEAAGLAAQATSAVTSSGTIVGLGVIGIVTLVLAASLVVLSLQDALNTIWEMPVRSGLVNTLLRRLLAVIIILATGAVVVGGFVINSFTAVIQDLVPDAVVLRSLTEVIGAAASWAIGVGVIVLLFRYLPDARAPWTSALVGGATTTVFVAVGAAAIGYYLRNFGASSLVGVTGSAVFVLLWLYYEAQIVLVGAEFTRVLAQRQLSASH
jgi:membrane protein